MFILQHPSESKHAKNSARLVKLILPQTQILVGETEEQFARLKQRVIAQPQSFHVIYPSTQSQPMESNLKRFSPASAVTLIFVDATWRKALKMWHLNPWLSLCQQWHFAHPPDGRYQIRKTSVDGGLSTLEAIAYTLKSSFCHDDKALLDLFAAMQSHHLEHRAK